MGNIFAFKSVFFLNALPPPLHPLKNIELRYFQRSLDAIKLRLLNVALPEAPKQLIPNTSVVLNRMLTTKCNNSCVYLKLKSFL